jgi:hypothetical protein
MAQITVAEATTRVLEAIGRVDDDEQCPATAIERRIDTVYRRLRRRLAAEFSSMYEALSDSDTITDDELDKPDDCEIVQLVQKQNGSSWETLGVLPSLNRDDCSELSYFEMGDVLKIRPVESAPGTYRMYYTTAVEDGYTTLDVPAGLEDIVIEEVAAWASARHNEDAAYHRKEADRIWDEQYMALWNRYGANARSGLNMSGG